MKNINYISAGAGSGKTYTLTHRLADHIIKGDVKPEEVILTTFTDKAATEFRERAKAALNEEYRFDEAGRLDLAEIGTVHSIAYKMVSKYWYILGLSPQLKVMDENDVNFFISQSLADLPTDEEIRFLNDFRQEFDIQRRKDYGFGYISDYDYWKNYLTKIVEKSVIFNVKDFTQSEDFSVKQVHDLYDDTKAISMHEQFIKIMFGLASRWKSRYHDYKREQHTLDFNDMEQYFLELLDKKEVSSDISSSYKYLFVDEFQDSSPVQVQIFDKLSDLMEKSYFVGDFKQAIYGFRGTDAALTEAVSNIISQGKNGCKMEKPLDTCWRSQPNIVRTVNSVFVKAFNALTPEAKARIELKPCQPMLDNENDDCLTYLDCGLNASDKTGNIIHLARDIAYIVAHGVKPTELAVLARSNGELDELASNLSDYKLPVMRDGGSIAESKETTLLFAMLRLLSNRGDQLAKAEIAYITEQGYSIGRIIDKKILFDDNKDEHKGNFLDDIPMVAKLLSRYDELHNMSVTTLVETLVLEFDLKNLSRKWDKTSVAYSNFDAIIASAKTYEQHCQQMTLPSTIDGFMQYLTNQPPVQAGDINGIRLFTYHGAKGLEWNHVIVMSLQNDAVLERTMIQKNFYGVSAFHEVEPSSVNLYPPMTISLLPWIYGTKQTIQNTDIKRKIIASKRYQITLRNEIEENKRLLYVAVTRAKEHLYFAVFSGSRMKHPLQRFETSGITVDTDADGKTSIDCLHTGISFRIIESEIEEFADNHQAELTYPASHEYEKAIKIAADACQAEKRDVLPSSADSKPGAVELVTEKLPRIRLGKIRDNEMAETGSCIHQIFCSLDRHKEDADQFITQVINEWNQNVQLPDRNGILVAWQNLTDWLNKQYGKPIKAYHELPFKHFADGQIITGNMDLVWRTSKGCVLVDYKTFPGKSALALQPGEHYAGNYKGQFDCYTHALEAAGETVLARYVYYPVSGMVVKI